MAMVETIYALTSLERVKEHAGITSSTHDVELLNLIDEVGSRMERSTGRLFISRQYVHDGETLFRLTSEGGTRLVLPQRPVTAVSVLKTYPTNDALTEGYDEDFIVDPLPGILKLTGGAFNGTVDNPAVGVVEITYTAGYSHDVAWGSPEKWFWGADQIGAEIGLACTRQVSHEFKAKDRGNEGIASISTEGATVTYLARPWLPEVEETLMRYKSPVLCL